MGELGRRIARITDDKGESAFLFQRMSVVIQRYNVVAKALSPTQPPRTTSSRSSISFAVSLAFNSRDLYYYRGLKTKTKTKINIIIIISNQHVGQTGSCIRTTGSDEQSHQYRWPSTATGGDISSQRRLAKRSPALRLRTTSG